MTQPVPDPVPIPSAETKSRRRMEIRAAAVRVFAAKGFDTATMRDIAQAVGTRAGSLYHHFRSKDELLYELLHDYYAEGLRQTREQVSQDKDAGVLLRESCERLLRYVLGRPLETLIIFNDYRALSTIPEFDFILGDQERVESLWVGLIERAIEQGYVRPEVNPVIAYRTISGAIFSAVRWFDPEGPLSSEEIVEQQTMILLRGIGVRT